MAYSQSDLEAIREAIANGTRSVSIGSPPKTVVFRDLKDLLEIERRIVEDLAAQSGTAPRRFGMLRAHRWRRGF